MEKEPLLGWEEEYPILYNNIIAINWEHTICKALF